MAMKPDAQEIAALYREAGSAGPSAELDRAILQAAHAAVAPRPAAAGWRRWRLSIPVLASLLMVGLFALLLSLEPPPAPEIGRIALNEAAPPAAPSVSQPAAGQTTPMPGASRARTAENAPPRAAAKMAAPARPAGETEPAATAGSAAEAPAGAAALADTAAPAQAKAEARAARAAAPANPARQAPGEWLAAIQQLIDKERLDEARASLKAFRQAYPAEAVPAAMDKRLKP